MRRVVWAVLRMGDVMDFWADARALFFLARRHCPMSDAVRVLYIHTPHSHTYTS